MAVTKLIDILPLETYVLKESGRRPRKKNPKPPYKYTLQAWEKKFELFLQFCNWKEVDGCLESPNGDMTYANGGFYCSITGGEEYIDVDCADEWYADDVAMELIHESGDSNTIVNVTRIKLQ